MSLGKDIFDKITLKKWFFVLAIVGLIIYINSFHNQMFWDDQDSILNNQFIKDWSYLPKYFSENLIAGAGLLSNYWRPALAFLFSLEWHIWSTWLVGWHFVNTAIHITNAALLAYLLYRVIKRKELSFITSLIFLVHPLQTEAITYVAGAADPLYFLWAMLCLINYVKWRESVYKTGKYLGWSLVCFALALMSKEIAIVIPGLVWLIEYYFYLISETKTNIKQTILLWLKKLWPFAGVVGFYVLLRATVLNFQNTFNLYNEANYYTTHFSARLYTFLKVIPEYFRLMFWPFNLHMERVVDIAVTITEWQVVLGLAIVCTLVYTAWHFRKIEPLVIFGVLWFFIGLSIVSNIFAPISGLMYEHWLYLPLIGIFIIVLALLDKFWPKNWPVGWCVFSIIFVVFLSILTISRNTVWQNPITFYNDVLKYNTSSLRVWNNLGMAYSEVGQNEKAIDAYKMAIALDPKKTSAPPWHNLGNIYRQMGNQELSIKFYEKALSVDEEFIFSYLGLAQLYYDNKDLVKAKAVLERAIVYYPNDSRLKQLIEYLTQQIQNAK